MKNYITVIITIVFFICPSICFSSYLIELKNGSTFVTNHNWEEGRQIKFYHYGGVVGIPKNLIKAIKKSDIAYKEERNSKQDGVDPKSKINEKSGITPIKKKEKSDSTPIEKKEKYETVDLEYYKEKKLLLETELNSTLDILREATKNKDQKAKKKARDEVKKISEKMYDLADELIKKNNGKLPEGW
ncbi:MAG: hypothetical protein LWW97_03445 [Deltaproteobacteria bacterium]|nr:hypothetical protein [Deltaproteobacteria bacterium]